MAEQSIKTKSEAVNLQNTAAGSRAEKAAPSQKPAFTAARIGYSGGKEDDMIHINSEEKDNNVCFYADYHKVNPLDYTDYNDFMENPDTQQEMPGFDPKYKDIVDYILRITHEIWEERGIGIIYDTYHNNTIAHSCSGTSTGVVPVVAGTLSHLHAFPDKKIVAENAIWSEDTPGYFFTSHRSMATATNLGDSNFGPKTGRRVHFRAIADCAIHKNRIYEEWLVRDNLSLVRELGLDPVEVAKKFKREAMAKHPGGLSTCYGLNESVEGQFYPKRYTAKDDSVGEMLLEMHQNVYSCKMLNEIKKFYDRNAKVHYIGGRELCGREEIQGTLISFLASFPNCFHTVERITCNNTPDGCWDAALRWRLRGLHDGIGMFGSPSGKNVEIMGINHYHIKNNKILESWIMYDAVDVLKQIVDVEETGAGEYALKAI